MPYSVGEYVSVKAAGWHGQITRMLPHDRYRVRVGGTGGSSLITRDLSGSALRPIIQGRRVRPRKKAWTTQVLDAFFRGDSGSYLILGDPGHGATSAEMLLDYCNKKLPPQITAHGAKPCVILMEGMFTTEQAQSVQSPSIKKVVKALATAGFGVQGAETPEIAPHVVDPTWLENQRVPLANALWSEMASRLAVQGNLVVLCCGTSHVGYSKKNVGLAEEPGMIGRLQGSEGYAVDNYDGKDALYTPERDNQTWTYDTLPSLFPLGEDYEEGDVEDDDEIELDD